MTNYSTDRSRFNVERAEQGQKLLAAALPLTESCPAVRYLTEQRGLPLEVVLGARDQLWLPSSARGRRPEEHALLSVLRVTPDGEPTGLQSTWFDIDGVPDTATDGRRKREYFSLVPDGCRDACWWGGAAGNGIVAAEGYAEKPYALLAAGVPGQVIGFGSRAWLKFKKLAGAKLTIVTDRAPGENDLAADGKLMREAHLRDYGANVDHWLLNGFLDRVWVTPDPACDCCDDADDVWRAHGAKAVRALLKNAMQGELGRSGWIIRLARIADDLDRKAAIKEAVAEATYGGRPLFKGVPIKDVRRRVQEERERQQRRAAGPAPGEVEPWDEPISDLAAVLDELATELSRFIATSKANLDAAALWAAMTHVFDRLECMPKLALQSPTKQCGKTTFLDCLANVVRRPELTSGVTEASFIRTSDAWQPTWLMDEADRYLNPTTAGEALTAAINASSYRRLARKKVCVPNPGGGWDMHDFEFWCPMIMAGIRSLVDTVQDRSIVLRMQRARPGELKHRLVNGTSPTFEEIARKLTRWAKDLVELDLDPVVPGFLHNREADLWRPLFALASEAGSTWPERVLEAAKTIHGERAEDEARLALLLEAIREEFGASGQMYATDLVARLIQREGEPWATIKRNGAPIDAYYLRGMLKGVITEQDRRQRENARGPNRNRHYYTRENFEEAWARYISHDPENDPAHAAHPAPEADTPGSEPGSVAPDQDKASGASPAPGTDGDGAEVAPDGANSSGATQDVDFAGETDAGVMAPDAPDQIRPDANTYAGLDTHCGFCCAPLNGGACVAHDGQVFHADACLAEYLKKRPRA